MDKEGMDLEVSPTTTWLSNNFKGFYNAIAISHYLENDGIKTVGQYFVNHLGLKKQRMGRPPRN